MITIPMQLTTDSVSVLMSVSADPSVSVSANSVIEILPEPYTGSYEITPNDSTQTLNVAGLSMVDNITINPIPSNYGRIGWNGAFLTVS